ncbi:aminopeptidase P N-terminal domain-containing protein [Marinomonas ostreistagni]|uniref:aminopeptidase P N-terminal domain-containing protein n=1 Tax=Marinomonas ostreistagni TaxID=359209 RepID=UPI001950ADF8|nr:aminopeptidase P N-terminal domain-containing protein [Marinomonas ostreistagni]MBM6552137.1 aminopeptidase P N-terminal domain-containing protein [Marinomonas ostreistagni]
MTLSPDIYRARRQRLMQQLGGDTVAVVRAGELCTRNNDCDYEFRPNSSFFYLTGFNEPSAVLFMLPDGASHLAVLPKDPEREQWDGFRHGMTGAMQDFAMDGAVELDELDDLALELLDGKQQVALLFDDALLRDQVLNWRDELAAKARQGAQAPVTLLDMTDAVHEMRLIKDSAEIELMERAAQISVQAHTQAMQSVAPGMMEYQLEAELNYVFMKQGARVPAYNNIVASGSNACVLHYIKNDEQIEDGDLILIDAGCELGCYASDITRTFPANGKFSEPQAQLYQLVLDAYHAGLKLMTVGQPYEAFHNAAVEVLTQGLVELGLLQGSVAELIESKAYRAFYMHNTGHWLGLDVHDCGRYKVDGASRPLQEGMVVTLEPGLYINPDDESVDPKWRGIGIRIEDDILIQAQGPYVLTHGLAKEIDEIEALMAANA